MYNTNNTYIITTTGATDQTRSFNFAPSGSTIDTKLFRQGAMSALETLYRQGISANRRMNVGDLRSLHDIESGRMFVQYYSGQDWKTIS